MKCMSRTVGIRGGVAAELGVGISIRLALFQGPSLIAVVNPRSDGGTREVDAGRWQDGELAPRGLIGALVNLG